VTRKEEWREPRAERAHTASSHLLASTGEMKAPGQKLARHRDGEQ